MSITEGGGGPEAGTLITPTSRFGGVTCVVHHNFIVGTVWVLVLIPPAPSTRLQLPLHIIATGQSTPSPSPTYLCSPPSRDVGQVYFCRRQREQQGRYLDSHVRRVRKHGGFCLCELQVQAGTAVSRLLVVVWSPPSLLTLQSIRDEEFTFENNVIC